MTLEVVAPAATAEQVRWASVVAEMVFALHGLTPEAAAKALPENLPDGFESPASARAVAIWKLANLKAREACSQGGTTSLAATLLVTP